MVRRIILATHGHLGEAVKEACELVMGRQKDISVLSIVTGAGRDDIYLLYGGEEAHFEACLSPGGLPAPQGGGKYHKKLFSEAPGHLQIIYSSRKIEAVCRRGINFMWLLAGQKALDHSTNARYCMQKDSFWIFTQTERGYRFNHLI